MSSESSLRAMLWPQNMQPNAWLHVGDSALASFYTRHYLQKAMALVRLTDIPENWDENYLKYAIFVYGYCGVVYIPHYGIIPQAGTVFDYNVYYQPAKMMYVSPFYRQRECRIGVDTEVIRLQPDWSSIMPICQVFGGMMAMLVENFSINAMNSKLAYVISAEKSSVAESFKEMIGKISEGQPAVVTLKNFFREDGTPKWTTFSQNLRENFIGRELLDCSTYVDTLFSNFVGVPAYTAPKKERAITAETRGAEIGAQCKAALWLDMLNSGCERVNKMFGMNIGVQWRYDLEREGGEQNANSSEP